MTRRLATGELEVLVTTLLDETTYPTQEFKELYHYRWGIETYYGAWKGRNPKSKVRNPKGKHEA